HGRWAHVDRIAGDPRRARRVLVPRDSAGQRDRPAVRVGRGQAIRARLLCALRRGMGTRKREMIQKEALKGILPAAVTPFDNNEQFAPAAFEALLESLYSSGVDGVYVCGGTGEGLLQT